MFHESTRVMETPLSNRAKNILVAPIAYPSHFGIGKPLPTAEKIREAKRNATIGDVLRIVKDPRMLKGCGNKTAKEIIAFFLENGYSDVAYKWRGILGDENKPVPSITTAHLRRTAFELFGVTEEQFATSKVDVRTFSPLRLRLCVQDGTLTAGICWDVAHGSAEETETFPDTWQGYKNACQWLDKKRIELIRTLV